MKFDLVNFIQILVNIFPSLIMYGQRKSVYNISNQNIPKENVEEKGNTLFQYIAAISGK